MSKKVEVITEPESTDLITSIEQTDPVAIYTGSYVDQLIQEVTKEVAEFKADLTTDKGRKAVASLAHKVAKVKVALDNAGKSLVAEWKQKSQKVDQQRKAIRDQLDLLKEEARKPLTEWEEEQARIEAEKKQQAEIALAHMEAFYLNDIFDREKALAEKEAAMQAEQDRIAAEKEAAEAEERRKVAEAEAAKRREEEEKQRKIDEEKRIAAAKEIAAKQERDRLERERLEEEAAQRRREENQRIVNRTHNLIAEKLIGLGLSKADSETVVAALAKGDIPKVFIKY